MSNDNQPKPTHTPFQQANGEYLRSALAAFSQRAALVLNEFVKADNETMKKLLDVRIPIQNLEVWANHPTAQAEKVNNEEPSISVLGLLNAVLGNGMLVVAPKGTRDENGNFVTLEEIGLMVLPSPEQQRQQSQQKSCTHNPETCRMAVCQFPKCRDGVGLVAATEDHLKEIDKASKS